MFTDSTSSKTRSGTTTRLLHRLSILGICAGLVSLSSCEKEEEEFICRTLDELSEEIMIFGDCSDGVDNDEDGDVDCEDGDCDGQPECVSNLPPTAPAIIIPGPGGPTHPVPTEMPMVCVLVIPAADPDGDTLHYRFEWTVDGKPSDYTGNQIQPEATQTGQEWTCAVTAFDGHDDGPTATYTVLIGENQPPSQPVVEITPSSPNVGENLDCTILIASVDLEGDHVTYFFEWSKDGDPVKWTSSEIFSADTESGDQWTCYVTPTDGMAEGESGEATVTIN
jgi:hypothetical protein